MMTLEQIKICQRLGLDCDWIIQNYSLKENILKENIISGGKALPPNILDTDTYFEFPPLSKKEVLSRMSEYKGYLPEGPYSLIGANVHHGMLRTHEADINEVLGNQNKYMGVASQLKPVSLLYVAKILLQRIAPQLAIIGITAPILAAIIYTLKRGYDYKKYILFCAKNNIKPLPIHKFESAVKILKQKHVFDKIKLKEEYKTRRDDIKWEITRGKLNKSLSKEDLTKLKNKLKDTKAKYKLDKRNLKQNYLADRKSNYGHF